MLALNKALQQAREETSIRFTQVQYAPSGAISTLLSEKADAGHIIFWQSNLLICAVKAVDPGVVGIEILEHWQRLKVHGMPLERYLGKRKMKLLKRKLELATRIQLKSVPQWFISKNRLREPQKNSNKRGSAIVITISSESEAKRLCVSRIRFGGILKVVEKYWELGPSSLCITCCGISYEQMGKCGDRQPRYVICTWPHKLEDYECGVTGCHKRKGKVCILVMVKCVNCEGSHSANSNQCIKRHKVEVDERKKKILRREKTKIVESHDIQNKAFEEVSPTPKDISLDADTGMNLESISWVGNKEDYSSEPDKIPEKTDYTLQY